MTNDEKITTIAKLLREMSDEFGEKISTTIYPPDKYSPDYKVVVSFEGVHGIDTDPATALTKALSEHERTAATRAIEAEVRAEVAARLADRKAA